MRRVQLACHKSKFQTLPATGGKQLTADHASAIACCSTMFDNVSILKLIDSVVLKKDKNHPPKMYAF